MLNCPLFLLICPLYYLYCVDFIHYILYMFIVYPSEKGIMSNRSTTVFLGAGTEYNAISVCSCHYMLPVVQLTYFAFP